MKYLFLFFTAVMLIYSCRHKHDDPDYAYRSLYEDSLNGLKPGDSALIYVSYPQGTAYYQYEFTEDSGKVILINHTTHRGDPDEAGGGMSETFYIKAIKPGVDTIRIVDESPAAVKAAADTVKPYRNYEQYIIKVEK